MNILGTGIDAIGLNLSSTACENQDINFVEHISLNQIVIGNYQPRKKGRITKESIQDLVLSIQEQGILQPIIVRKIKAEQYELIAGERRYLSAFEAGLKKIPCVIKNVNERDAFAIALIENIQREQLSLLEESEALLKLKEEHLLSVDEVSKVVGKPRTTIANLIRVASLLSPNGKLLWERGDVDYGHIRSVVTLDHEFQDIVLQHVVQKKLSVRETEKLVKNEGFYSLDNKKDSNFTIPSEEVRVITKKFSELYNKEHNIKVLKSGKIRISVEFENLDMIYNYLAASM